VTDSFEQSTSDDACGTAGATYSDSAVPKCVNFLSKQRMLVTAHDQPMVNHDAGRRNRGQCGAK
jgi:hypothetical protein